MKAKKVYTKVFNNKYLASKYYSKVKQNKEITFCWMHYSVEIKGWEIGWQY
jgi:hypothetical protein